MSPRPAPPPDDGPGRRTPHGHPIGRPLPQGPPPPLPPAPAVAGPDAQARRGWRMGLAAGLIVLLIPVLGLSTLLVTRQRDPGVSGVAAVPDRRAPLPGAGAPGAGPTPPARAPLAPPLNQIPLGQLSAGMVQRIDGGPAPRLILQDGSVRALGPDDLRQLPPELRLRLEYSRASR